MAKKETITFEAAIQKFGNKGEKTGWTYIAIPEAMAAQLMPGTKTSFRVKGSLDNLAVEQVALIPMGNGDFILPLNSAMRRKGGFAAGGKLTATLSVDASVKPLSPLLLACLEDAPIAKAKFEALPLGHRRYYSNWIESAKGDQTKQKRVAQCIIGLERGLDFGASTKLDI